MNNLSKKQYPSNKYLTEIVGHIKLAEITPIEAVRAMARELLAYREAQGKVSFDALRDAVAEMTGGIPLEWQSSEKGHHAVPFINFNSLARIVDKFSAAPQLPVVPDGWALVPIEPTEDMVIYGFESSPAEAFSSDEYWEAYQAMSGCEQAAYRARLCWAAMIKAAPKQENI